MLLVRPSPSPGHSGARLFSSYQLTPVRQAGGWRKGEREKEPPSPLGNAIVLGRAGRIPELGRPDKCVGNGLVDSRLSSSFLLASHQNCVVFFCLGRKLPILLHVPHSSHPLLAAREPLSYRRRRTWTPFLPTLSCLVGLEKHMMGSSASFPDVDTALSLVDNTTDRRLDRNLLPPCPQRGTWRFLRVRNENPRLASTPSRLQILRRLASHRLATVTRKYFTSQFKKLSTATTPSV